MQYEQFITRLVESGRFSDEDRAGSIARATLETLGQRVTGGEARDVAAQLPDPLAGWITAQAGGDDEAQPWETEEFLARIGQRLDGDDTELTTGQIGSVLAALRDALSEGETSDLFAQLPPELHRFAETGA